MAETFNRALEFRGLFIHGVQRAVEVQGSKIDMRTNGAVSSPEQMLPNLQRAIEHSGMTEEFLLGFALFKRCWILWLRF